MKNKLNFITKSLLIKTFAVLIVIGMMDSMAFSQTRISFARGRTSKTIKGQVHHNSGNEYVINGKKGQTMTIKVISSDGTVGVYIGDNASKNITLVLESDEDYKFSVNKMYKQGYSNYTMTVSIK